MHTIFIDTSALACPRVKEGSDGERRALNRYIARLLDLEKLLHSSAFRALISRSSAELLFEANLYPIHNELRNSLSVTGLDSELQSSDVVKVLDKLLKELPLLEELIELDSFLHELGHLDTPSIILTDEYSREELIYQYIALGIGDLIGNFSAGETWILGEAKECNGVEAVKVLAKIIEIDWLSDEIHLTPPIEIDAKFPFKMEVLDIQCAIDLATFRRKPSNEFIQELIELALLQRQTKEVLHAALDWTLGADFAHTVEALHVQNNSTVFRALLDTCVDIICETRMTQTHRLRSGEGGANEPRRSGNFIAWRRDIDAEFHLHYWLSGNRCELASVVVHNDFTIPDCG